MHLLQVVHWILHIAWKFLHHAGFHWSSFSPWLCLVELKLSSVKAISCPFPWYKVGLAGPPPPPHHLPHTLVLGLYLSWVRWYEHYGTDGTAEDLWHHSKRLPSWTSRKFRLEQAVQKLAILISKYEVQSRYCHTWHCGIAHVTPDVVYRNHSNLLSTNFCHKLLMNKLRRIWLKVVLKKKKKARKAFESGLCIPGWLPWK